MTRRDNCLNNRGLAWIMWGHMTICCWCCCCCCICNRMKKGKSHKLLYDGIVWICQRGEMANFRMAHVVTAYSKNKKKQKKGKVPRLDCHTQCITGKQQKSFRSYYSTISCLLDIVFCQLPFGCRSIKKEARKQKFLVFSLPTFGNLLPAACCDKKFFFSPPFYRTLWPFQIFS